MIVLAVVVLLLAFFPALLFARNWSEYRPAPVAVAQLPALSVLIPARDEERNIGDALRAILTNRGVEFEVVVLDDHSSDRTAEIVKALAAKDARVRLASAPPLPPGWCGKEHACAVLATHAQHDVWAFVDADVRLAPDALARFAAFMEASGCDLASGVPRQITGTFLEKLLIPLIHFVLLGFLPFHRMRQSTDPALASAIGQLVIVRRTAYELVGGHAAIWNKVHDGLGLARLFRQHGRKTDLFDATDTATCRMYEHAADVWSGLAKNATEAMATPRLIGPCTALLFIGQVVPILWLILGHAEGATYLLLLLANSAWLAVRIASAVRFRQSWLGALLHPLGVTLLLVIQWQAFFAKILGRPALWKGRELATRTAAGQ